jgi:hypothetical protein
VSALASAPPRERSQGGRADDLLPRKLSLFDELGGEPTLDELLSGVWEGLAAQRSVACPACGGAMEPVYGAHSRPIGGRCGHCQTVLR